MKVYIKIHCRSEIACVACCDEDLINKVFKEDNLRIEISEHFYGGNLVNIDEAIHLLGGATSFNLVGDNIINAAINHKIVPKDGVSVINGVPMAMKMLC